MHTRKPRKHWHWWLLPATLTWIIAFSISTLGWWIPADKWWLPTLAGIAYYPLLLCGVFLLVISIFFSRKLFAAILFCVLMSWPLLRHTIPFRFVKKPFEVEKSKGSLRIMQFNVQGLSGTDATNRLDKAARQAFVDTLNKYQPDIICLQELGEMTHNKWLRSNLSLLRDTLQFPYIIYQPWYYIEEQWGWVSNGLVIASKHPIENRQVKPFSDKNYPEHILAASISTENGPLTIATTHFQSMFLNWPETYKDCPPQLRQDSAIINSRNKWLKFQYFQPRHALEARVVKAFLKEQKGPIVFCADLNNVPASWPYRTVSDGLKDAWLESGQGTGSSFEAWLPHLRIDHVFVSPGIQVLQMRLLNMAISDHRALMTDIVLPISHKP